MIATLTAPPIRRRAAAERAQLRCVVVGDGTAGQQHLRNLGALGIDAVTLAAQNNQFRERDGHRSIRCWDEAAAFEPNIAIIANPTAQHVDAALEATRLGCHVLIEKPVADRIEPTLQLQAAVARRKTTALVGYQYRFHPTLCAVRDWLREGVIGETVSAHAHWGEYLPGVSPVGDARKANGVQQEVSEGVMLRLSHPLDCMRWLLGEVISVSAMTARRPRLTVGIEDVAILALRMKSGALASISLDYAEQASRHTLQVIGTAGTISWSAESGEAHFRCNRGATNLWLRPERSFDRNSLFASELQHFLGCVNGTEQPNCTLQDGVRSVTIAECVLQSAREGRVICA